MNGLKREKQDEKLGNHKLVRSHRDRTPRAFQGILVIVMAASLTSGLSIGVVAWSTPSVATHPMLPAVSAAQPLTLGVTSPGVPDKIADAQERAQAQRAKALIAGYRQYLEQKRHADQIEMVINFALAQQGKRYVFGTAGPSTYDCSGLVLAAFHKIGIDLYHYTGVMLTKGSNVRRSELQRGDIIFPSSNHVAIYLGSGMQVAASSGKGQVVVQPVTGFYAARRLV